MVAGSGTAAPAGADAAPDPADAGRVLRDRDYLFLFSNVPAPRAADRVREAVRSGRRPLVVYFRRPWTPLHAEELPGSQVVVREASFHATEPRRLLDVIRLERWLRRTVFVDGHMIQDGYADAPDLLAALIAGVHGRGCRLRYEMRDLHPIQLSRGPVGMAVRALERLLLRRVSVLILTSEAFYERYYQDRYSGQVVIVENWPDLDPWRGFRRRPHEEFVIGHVGVVRYLRCLHPLLRAVARLRSEGVPVRLKIAGGDATGELHTIAGSDGIDLLGPFQYDSQIGDIYGDVDLIYSVYDTGYENVRLAMPNKFYEAIIAGIPILVASGTYLEQRVRAAGIGASVPCDDEDAIAARIVEAARGEGWYAAAREELARADVQLLRGEQAAALTRAVIR